MKCLILWMVLRNLLGLMKGIIAMVRNDSEEQDYKYMTKIPARDPI